MDKRKIYVISFIKTYMKDFKPEYAYISDSVIMSILKDLSETHSFKLLSVYLSNSHQSTIKIKCYSYNMEDILYDLINKLGDKIEQVSCRRRLF